MIIIVNLLSLLIIKSMEQIIIFEQKNPIDKYNKTIFSKMKCIINCNNNDKNIFEFNGFCFEKCPKGTVYN